MHVARSWVSGADEAGGREGLPHVKSFKILHLVKASSSQGGAMVLFNLRTRRRGSKRLTCPTPRSSQWPGTEFE